jgi:hypothetical protein
LYLTPRFIQRMGFIIPTLLQWLILGSIPIFLYSLGQQLHWIPIVASVGIGGTFQNQNHLSFYAGLLLLINGYLGSLFLQQRKQKRAFCFFSYACLCLYFIFLGQSRTSGGASIACFALFFLVEAYTQRKNTWYFQRIALFSLIGISFTCAFFLLFDVHHSEKFRELRELWHAGSLSQFFQGGGRNVYLPSAIEALKQSPWTGIGMGYFFSKSLVGYEIHNTLLDWIVGCGWIVLPIFIFFLGRSIWALQKDKNTSFSFFLIILGYILATSLFDAYLSYRSLMQIAFFLLLLPFLDLPIRKKTERKYGWFLFLSCLSRISHEQPSISSFAKSKVG